MKGEYPPHTTASTFFPKISPNFISKMALRTLLTRKSLANVGLGFQQQLRGLQTFSLPDLPYSYDALEPVVSKEIMEIHHKKHHQAYITNYNKALQQLDAALNKGDASTVVKLQSAIKFNGGGHVNHSIFWKNLTPIQEGGGEPPKGSLGSAIDKHFGSLESLVQKMNGQGAALQGSGWVWLGVDKDLKRLVIETTANQVFRNTKLGKSMFKSQKLLDIPMRLVVVATATLPIVMDPLVTKGPSLVPLLGIDVWEHAYYLQYQNVRPDYLKNIWKVINWKYASEIYEKESP